jgi:hypothetical protein
MTTMRIAGSFMKPVSPASDPAASPLNVTMPPHAYPRIWDYWCPLRMPALNRTAGSDGAAEWTKANLRDLLFRQGRDRRPISCKHEIARAHGVNWHKGRSQKDVADFMCHGPLHAVVGDRAGWQLCGVPGASVVALLMKLINDEDCNIGIGNGSPELVQLGELAAVHLPLAVLADDAEPLGNLDRRFDFGAGE